MRVSVLGLGNMGRPIAGRLLDAGHDVAVWNRTEGACDGAVSRGATRLGHPHEAWEHGPLAVVVLAHDQAVRSVVAGRDGLLDGSRRVPGRTIVEMSTISVTGSAELAALAHGAGIGFLRAPVSGNPSVVEAGGLGIIVSGPRESYETTESLLRDIGPTVFYVGTDDQARVIKLALQLMIGGTSQLIAEALLMAERSSIDRATMLEVMGGSAIGSPFVRYKAEALVADDYTATFSATGLHKDLSLARDCAAEAGVPVPVTALVQSLVQDCIDRGLGELDMMALLPRLELEAGQVKSTAAGTRSAPRTY